MFARLLHWKKRVTKRIGEPALVKQLTRDFSSGRFLVKAVLLFLAFSAGVVAIASLRKPVPDTTVLRKGIDVIIALDVSKSMLATDLAPSRLERAKQTINKLIDRLPEDRIGLIFFAGRAYLQMPLTTDHAAAKLFVNAASPDLIPTQGTVLTQALDMGSRAFNSQDERFKTIVLISDGEDHSPGIEESMEALTEAGILVHTIGIGSPQGSEIIDPQTGEVKKDASGNIVISKLNEAPLQQIAQQTNGTYTRLESSELAVNSIMEQLSGIEGKTFGDTSLMNYQHYYGWFAGLMLLFMIIEFFLPETKKVLA